MPGVSGEHSAAWGSVAILELCLKAQARLPSLLSAVVLHWDPSLFSFLLLISCLLPGVGLPAPW